jgi:hypothetical protein
MKQMLFLAEEMYQKNKPCDPHPGNHTILKDV